MNKCVRSMIGNTFVFILAFILLCFPIAYLYIKILRLSGGCLIVLSLITITALTVISWRIADVKFPLDFQDGEER